MISGYCTVYSEEYKREVWPEAFVSVPRVGEMVQSKDGCALQVVMVTHLWVKRDGIERPEIEVELHPGAYK